jgi:hypothetical protein
VPRVTGFEDVVPWCVELVVGPLGVPVPVDPVPAPRPWIVVRTPVIGSAVAPGRPCPVVEVAVRPAPEAAAPIPPRGRINPRPFAVAVAVA